MIEERRSHTFVWVAAALLVLAVGYRLLASRAPDAPAVEIDGVPAEEAARRSGPGGGSTGARGAARARVYVHVAGAVRRPGLYRLPPGARVAAALELAGGPTRRADLTGTNLAARVEDGQQIVVALRGRAGPVGALGPGAGATGAGAQISLASATQEQLEELDGIGPTLAQRIIEYRDAHGGFRSIEELAEVDGIGEKRLESLREAVRP